MVAISSWIVNIMMKKAAAGLFIIILQHLCSNYNCVVQLVQNLAAILKAMYIIVYSPLSTFDIVYFN